MASIRVRLHFKYANGENAASLGVQVIDSNGGVHDIEQTDDDGRIDAVVHIANEPPVPGLPSFPDPVEPSIRIVVRDIYGNAFSIKPTPAPFYILPPAFDPPQAPTVPVLVPRTPTAIVDRIVRKTVGNDAPGYVFYVRRDGIEWIDATRGLARVTSPTTPARAMTKDTVVHLASMSKPITATAVVAMIEDWTAIQLAVAQIGRFIMPTTRIELETSRPGGILRNSIDVPTVLAPLFADRGQARAFLKRGLPTHTKLAVLEALEAFAAGLITVSAAPAVPPGHFGLLKRVIAGKRAPDLTAPFLPLIRQRLDSIPIGVGVEFIQISDLINHRTDLVNRMPDPAIHGVAVVDALKPTELIDAPATYDYWGILRLLLREPCRRTSANSYGNTNYVVLTAVVEACTETAFDQYVTQRLFSDPRFALTRRQVTNRDRDAFYYNGRPRNRTGGVRLADYRNFAGHGGFYTIASQLTDWLHALYFRQTVGRVEGAAPLISPASHLLLFSSIPLFSAGKLRIAGPDGLARRYQHNGGTDINGGAMGGNMAIVVSPAGTIYSALFVANGQLSGGADPPFDDAVAALPWD